MACRMLLCGRPLFVLKKYSVLFVILAEIICTILILLIRFLCLIPGIADNTARLRVVLLMALLRLSILILLILILVLVLVLVLVLLILILVLLRVSGMILHIEQPSLSRHSLRESIRFFYRRLLFRIQRKRNGTDSIRSFYPLIRSLPIIPGAFRRKAHL